MTAVQGDLFGIGAEAPKTTQEPPNPAPRQRHSRTSCGAAEGIHAHVGALQRRLIAALATVYPDGLTDIELQEQTGIRESTERPRRVELVEAGLILDSGRTRVAPGRTRAAVVWVLSTNPGNARPRRDS